MGQPGRGQQALSVFAYFNEEALLVAIVKAINKGERLWGVRGSS